MSSVHFPSLFPTYPSAWLYFNFCHEKSEKLFSLLLTTYIEDSKFQNFLMCLLDVFPKTDNYLDERWSLVTTLKPYKELKDDLSIKMAKIDFENSKTEFTAALKPLLAQPEIPEAMAHPTCFYFLLFRDSLPGLFYTLLPEFAEILQKIGSEVMFKAIGPEALSFIVNPDFDFFQKLEVDPKNFVLFFKYPIVYTNHDFALLLQKKFALKTPQCKIVDLAIINQTHFFDYFDKFFTNFLNSKNPNKLPDDLSIYRGAVPFYIIKNYELILSNPEKYGELLNGDYSKSPVFESILRLRNDIALMQSITFYKPDGISPQELIEHSITYHFQFSLGTPTVLELANKNYFLIPDNHRKMDFDVIKAYMLLRVFLSSFKAPSKQLKQNMHTIKNHLNTITPDVRKNVLIDLFSLIFIKQKSNDSYICHPIIAGKLIKLLLEFSPDNPFFNGANAIFSSKKPKKNDSASISNYLHRDTNEVYQFIEQKKWDAADERTKFTPYHRKFYLRAHAAHLIYQNQQLTGELEKQRETAILDLTCSTLNRQMIKETLETKKDYIRILQPRMKAMSTEQALQCIRGNMMWDAAMKSAKAIDQSPLEQIGNNKKSVGHLKNITVSKNLLTFVSNCVLYFESASLFPDSDGNLESVFTFDMRKALAGPFNIDNEKKTEQLAAIFKVDLFPFIINNLEWFEIREKFVEKHIDEEPIVSMALALHHNFYQVLNTSDKVSQEIKKSINKSFTNKKKPMIITQLKNNNLDDIEDYIYKIDHKKLYSKIFEEFDHKNFNDATMFVLDICDYAAPESDLEELENIRLYYNIHKITTETEPVQVVDAIFEADKFNLAIEYIKKCVDPDDWSAPILKLFQLSLDCPEKMCIILRQFQDRFDLISSRFFHIDGVVQYLIQECPKSKTDIIRSLSLLPDIIAQDSNIFDLSTVIESFARHPECIFMINKDTASLFTDNDLQKLIDMIDSTPYYRRAFPYLHQFFADKNGLYQRWKDKVLKIIDEVKVNSIEDEIKYLEVFKKKIEPYLQYFKGTDAQMQWIKCSNAFIAYNPYCKFHISYDFGYYSKKKLEFARLCSNIDKMEISRSLNLKIQPIVLDQIKKMIILGQTKAVKTMLGKLKNLKFDDFDTGKTYYDRYYQPFASMTHNMIFDMTTVNKIAQKIPVPQSVQKTIGPLFVFQQIKVTLSPKNMKERDPFYDYMIKNAVTKPNSLAFLVSYRDYETAFEYLDTKTGEERNDLFLHKFYLPAISTNTINSLEKYILTQKGVEYSRFIWTNTLHFFEARQCRHTMFNINRKLGNWEAAADASFRLFDDETDLMQQINLLGHAIYCLTEALNGQTEEDRAIVEDRKAKTMFQLKLCQFFVDRGTPNKKEYNLMRGETAALALGSLFMINGERDLLIELNDLIQINPKAASLRASNMLLEMNVEQIMNSLSMMNSMNPGIKEYVQSALIRKLQAKGNRQIILNLILSCYTDTKIQCSMMIEYDYINEAMLLAVRERMGEMIPQIAKRASELGLIDIVTKCDRILNPPGHQQEA
ncbi:hypothetical protein TRFO_31334 [Tritrichomonas foetus]|uniref:Uncharacterized protein n=1 Tax=Tritrichomonas foetus TaxID=1144522 RepID=A0A1J4JW26_9EUKA|nr:hypothetical protein TRFO_31334 [Tritrichomonas foetus]|eukprot:OHT01724.1 hypothetical protein TRFO_31334 [Tritrichomonas foetus]